MTTQRISVVLTVDNESGNLQECLRGISAALKDHDHEILVCHSSDAAMPDLPDTVRLISNEPGKGPASATRAGFKAAEGDVIVSLMADLTYPPDAIPAMAEKIRAMGFDVVVGSRNGSGGSRVAGLCLHWIAGVGKHDPTSNFRAYSRSFLESQQIQSAAAFEIALELTSKAHRMQYRVGEVPSSGTNPFRFWPWLPRYLRWYLPVMAVPLLLVTLWGVLGIAMLASIGPVSLVSATGGLATSLIVRRKRGSLTARDLIIVLVWLWPLHHVPDSAVEFILHVLAFTVWSCSYSFLVERSPDRPARPSSPWPRRLLLAGAVIAAVVVFQLPAVGHGSMLDISWADALNHFRLTDARAGEDYVVTFGPLGFLYRPNYHPQIHAEKMGLELIYILVFGWALFLQLGRMDRWAAGVLLAFLLLHFQFTRDSNFWLLIVFLSLPCIRSDTRPEEWMPRLLPAIALSFVKFSMMPLTALCFGMGVLMVARNKGMRTAIAVSVLGIASLACVWIACGEPLANLPGYMRNSAALAAGYSEAMAKPGPLYEILLAGAGLAALGLALAIRARHAGSKSFTMWVEALALLGAMFVAWKAGFVRQDIHAVTFFACLFIGACGIPRIELSSLPTLRLVIALRALAMVIAVSGILVVLPRIGVPTDRVLTEVRFHYKKKAGFLWSPRSRTEALQRRYAQLEREFDLPRVRAVVGRKTIDIIPHEQRTLLLNRFHWHPRPVFQGYFVYTPRLLDLNTRFMTGLNAPEFLLAKLQTIDGRFPALDDSGTLIAVLSRYEPVLVENNYLLLRRSKADFDPTRVEILDREIAWDTWLDLPAPREGRTLLARIDVGHTIPGRVRSFLFRSLRMWMEVVTEDGIQKRFRFLPPLAGRDFLVFPLLFERSDLVLCFEGIRRPRIKSIRFVGEEGWTSSDSPVRVRLVEVNLPIRIRKGLINDP